MGGACTYQPSSWLLQWPAHRVAEGVGRARRACPALAAVMECVSSPAERVQQWLSGAECGSGLRAPVGSCTLSVHRCTLQAGKRRGSSPKEGGGGPSWKDSALKQGMED